MPSTDTGRRDFLRRTAAAAAGAAVASSLGPVVSAATQAPVAQQYSLAYLTLLGCPPPEMTYIAGRAGYDFVSLRPIYMGLPNEPNFDLAANPQLLAQTRTALKSTGVRLLDIELARIQDGLNPKQYEPALTVGAELGAKHVISSIWTDNRAFAVDCYARLCEMARPLGLTIDLEFVTFASVKNLQQAVEVLQAVKAPNGGLLVDTLHFSRSRVTLDELRAVPREWMHFAHVCDGPPGIPATNEELIRVAREARLSPGEGGIDVAGILGRLPPVPYSLEIPNLARSKELGFAEHAFRCLRDTRRYVERQPLPPSRKSAISQ